MYKKDWIDAIEGVLVAINAVSLTFAIIILFMIKSKNTKVIWIYFWWKCIEIVLMPTFEIIEIVRQKNKMANRGWPTAAIVILVLRTVLRLYFLYIIFSFVQRVNRGESLLVEYGNRRLNRMIDEIKSDQQK
jgi:hypothetical protein